MRFADEPKNFEDAETISTLDDDGAKANRTLNSLQAQKLKHCRSLIRRTPMTPKSDKVAKSFSLNSNSTAYSSQRHMSVDPDYLSEIVASLNHTNSAS